MKIFFITKTGQCTHFFLLHPFLHPSFKSGNILSETLSFFGETINSFVLGVFFDMGNNKTSIFKLFETT